MTVSETDSDQISRFSAYALKSADAGTLRNIVFSSSSDPDLLKIKGTLKLIGGVRMLQMEKSLTEGRVVQENISLDIIPETVLRYFSTMFSRVDLNDASGSASLLRSKKGKITAVLPGALRSSLDNAATVGISAAMEAVSQNNREKKRLLRGDEPFLIELGISDASGRVHDKKQAKYRQICRFSELVMEALSQLPDNGDLYIADLCCGKSYLSFAVYYVLKYIARRNVSMVCMDLKKSVVDFCALCAKKLGYTGMQFLCGDIATFQPQKTPDMVISLHACDTATDVVLDTAAAWRVPVILSTPCCQRALSQTLSCQPLDFIAVRPILRRKFCDAATDSLRLLRLECMGYSADALEFIDPEDTPKNIMLRAYLKHCGSLNSAPIRKKREQYVSAYRFLCDNDPAPFSDVINIHAAEETESVPS